MTRTEDPSAGFALLRALALYLVSVLTAMAALVAWPWAASLATALLVAPAAAGALVVGELCRAVRGRRAADVARPGAAPLRDRVRGDDRDRGLRGVGGARAGGLRAGSRRVRRPPARVPADRGRDGRRAPRPRQLPRDSSPLSSLRGGLRWPRWPRSRCSCSSPLFLLADNAVRILGAYAARRGPAPGTCCAKVWP